MHLLLQHVPDHVIGDWPRGDSNILDGLRLALGLGEERGGNRLGAGGRLMVSRTVLAFVSAALRDGEDDTGKGSFWGWLDDGGAKIKIRERGNGKERAVGKPETGVEMVEEGYLVGIGEWGVRDDRAAEWGLGRLGGGVATGDETSGTDVVSVSLTNVLAESAHFGAFSNCTSNYTPSSSQPFSNPLRSPSPLHIPQTPQMYLKTHRSASASPRRP